MQLITKKGVKEIPLIIDKYDTFLKRLRGLMFRLKPIQTKGIIIEPCNSIHMFFMFFSIDVVFLNKRNEIVYQKSNVKPWTIILPIKNAKSALELPVGTILKYGFCLGDYIEI
jgi:uncharacterized protein